MTDRHPWRWIGRFSRSSIHRPKLSSDFWGGDEHGPAGGYVDLTWGDRYGDPVWGVGFEFPVPRWFMDWYVRRWNRRHGSS